MTEKPINLGHRSLDEIIDYEYAGGVSVQTLLTSLQSAEHFRMFAPHDRDGMVKAARKQINSAEHAPLSTFYLAANAAGLLPEHPELTPETIASFRQLLNAIDTDHNDILTPTEMHALANASTTRQMALKAQMKTGRS